MGIPILTAPAQAVLMMLAGWLHRQQQTVVEYQKEEIRVLRELLGAGRPKLTDEQRRRLAIKSRGLSHRTHRELGSIVTPDTLTPGSRSTLAASTTAAGDAG